MSRFRELEPKSFSDYHVEAPIRLHLAAKIAFPDGSIGASSLRKERDAGRLTTEIIANKEYTTLAAIERMRELCRVKAKEPALSGGRKAANPTGSSGATQAGTSKITEGELAQDAAEMTLARLRIACKATSRKNTPRRGNGTVIPIK
ncbi:conserved hypothetical protein [Mesorhizobium prunaredense]|uniref:Uncharacterized protein n=1 Tax=Mesorhizobium prunaredense TaxID=1631249 RepID=A0A1R3VE53_9HYPH|nr:conserved hypothetical protein [Mesorhizobium prunaredense]